ncbi:chorismate mutase [Streptomyces sp. Ru73]|uniref:chorismate mutase n=1 Tax=Streptomyces sp. Ru73 TaxID=2080748 RepID=UPI000CDE09E7|nr:chorismate mutase [Streptomyces sp. Ru73]POX40290.1 chorismate mutase [Streptomyces sp. Ru73]
MTSSTRTAATTTATRARTVTDATAPGRPAAGGAAAAPAAARPRPETGARTEEAAALIGDARRRIDDIDGRIIGLVQERMAVSAVIQRERIASGGRRVSLSREMEILEHFREQLGRPGTALAMTLLELCRGRI